MAGLPIQTKELCFFDNRLVLTGVSEKAKWVKHDDLFRFYRDPTHYRAVELHGSGPDKASGDQGITADERFWVRKVSALEHLLSRVFLPRVLNLNVLIVENDFPALQRWDAKSILQHQKLWLREKAKAGCFGFLTKTKFYVIDGMQKQSDFNHLRTQSSRKNLTAQQYTSDKDGNLVLVQKEIKVPWGEIDLVLQDIMLGKSFTELTGLQLTSFYFEACPQALVFLLTGMDIESLAMSGDVDWKYVDAIISKRKLGSLWWNYYQAFCRVFGRMFWAPFTAPKSDQTDAGFGGRTNLRKLFRSLRRWQKEPAILGHGQGVAEMIDHSHRHITGLWRLADDVVGTLVENTSINEIQLTIQGRMLFTMSVWLHDIGHRGNEFTDDSGEIRMNHSGMSEYLILRNPSAYGIGWLEEFCQIESGCGKGSAINTSNKSPHLKYRNSPDSCNNRKIDICPLRKVGLLCRHHQSSAPLDSNSLSKMCDRGKFPSPYSRYKNLDLSMSSTSSQDELEEWLTKAEPLSCWCGSGVRLLDDFNVEEKEIFMAWVGLLRMLDGLQINRARVGSPSSLASFQEYLAIRSDWGAEQLKQIDKLLSRMTPGSKEYQEAIGKRFQLERYKHSLRVQYIHWWRQIAVHDIKVLWHWTNNSGINKHGQLEIQFELDDAGLEALGDLQNITLDGKDYDLKKILQEQWQQTFGEIKLEEMRQEELSEKKAEYEQLDRIAKALNEHQSIPDTIPLWIANVFSEMIWPEHSSQFRDKDGVLIPRYLELLPRGVGFIITLKGTTTVSFKPIILLEHPGY
ncbi:MAG: hypothetical protein HGB14_04065 [Anaerolineaceae bacterium]|nr:hypothetical protein [Anaerolineaceae bacterium]